MAETFDHAQPIYLQLVRRICWQIVSGERKAGDKLPSVREMAIDTGVNPNTIQRTYSELERQGIAEMRRGQGTFVSENKNTLTQLRKRLKDEQIESFIHDMKEMGFKGDEMISGLQQHLHANKGGTYDD